MRLFTLNISVGETPKKLLNARLKTYIEEYPNATIIHLGCGLDSRCLRVKNNNISWYDIDFPLVIEERKKYYTENELANNAKFVTYSSGGNTNYCAKNIQYGEDGLFVNDLRNHKLSIHTLPFIGYLHRHGNLTHRVYTPFSNINTLNDLYNHIYYNIKV